MDDNTIILIAATIMEIPIVRALVLSLVVAIPIIAWRLPEIIRSIKEFRR